MMGKLKNKVIVLILHAAIFVLIICTALFLFAGCAKEGEDTNKEQNLQTITIVNKSDFDEKWYVGGASKRIKVSFSPDSFNSGNVDADVTSSDSSVVAVDEQNKWLLKAVGVGEATITVEANGKKDSVLCTVSERDVPVLDFAEEVDSLDVFAETKTELPEMVARSCDGVDLRTNVKVVSAEGIDFDESVSYFTAEKSGKYSVTLSLSDPLDETKIAEKTFWINVSRKVFGSYYSDDVSMRLDVSKENDSAQTATVGSDKTLFAEYNAEPSKVYYAEATFTAEVEARMLIGMTHSVKGSAERYLTTYVDTGAAGDGRWAITRDVEVKNLSDWGNWDEKYESYTQEKLAAYRGIYVGEKAFPVKIAVARMNDYFYVFINDEYVVGYTNSYFGQLNTVPGIFGKNICKDTILTDRLTGEVKAAGTTIKNMTYLTGAEATEKYNELTANGCKIMSAGVFGDGSLGSLNTNNQRFTSGEYSETDGVNLKYTYDLGFPGKDGGISPYMYFDGDFEFEFTYELEKYGMDGDRYKYGDERLEVFLCPASNLTSGEIKKFGAYFYGNNKNTYLFSGDNKSEAFALDETTKLPVNTITFKVKRVDGSVTVTVTENGENGKSVTETFTNSETLFIRMENIGIAGQYTNIKWSVPTAQVTE